ncbi:helix-turn-helix transcriptional regulator [Actinacidiphila yeochonensis]|uniref:helix-turn-helix transcriptional regulator n=1 Tax=Actinacidiphila yeochonensis TaxID=89050 RepID=UPI00099C2FF4|nr:helix-turn-helix domain-containing protein [Actinacidiphila yeochonensis]
MEEAAPTRTSWTFLTNHARVLAAIARDPGTRVRDIAAGCLLTERAVQKIIADLETAGYLTHRRTGRTNFYTVAPGTPLRHPADAGPTVGDLLTVLTLRPQERTAPGSDPAPSEAVGPAGRLGADLPGEAAH